MNIDGNIEKAIIKYVAHLENEESEQTDAIITTILSKHSSRQRKTSGIIQAVSRQIGWRNVNRDQIIKRIYWLKNMNILKSNGQKGGEDMWCLTDNFKMSMDVVEE